MSPGVRRPTEITSVKRARRVLLQSVEQHKRGVALIAASARLPRPVPTQVDRATDKHEASRTVIPEASTTSTRSGGSSGCS